MRLPPQKRSFDLRQCSRQPETGPDRRQDDIFMVGQIRKCCRLNSLGLPTDDLLNHGGPRLVYGVELTHNTRAYLLGMEQRPKYILPLKKPLEITKDISRWWTIRWLLPRIDRDDILERVARH